MSIPHRGTGVLPGLGDTDFADPAYVTFPWGYSDLFVADVYDDALDFGATVVTTPYSRLFVDVNRRRDDFESNGEVRSERGVLKTHLINGKPIFTTVLTPAGAEERLASYYDPFHATLESLIEKMHRHFGRVVLLDAHTGSPNGMKDHEVVIGTRHGKTADGRLGVLARQSFEAQGFVVAENVRGYSGGEIIRRHNDRGHDVHAVQLEINSGLLMTTPRNELIATMMRGERPVAHRENIARAKAGVSSLLNAIGSLQRPIA